MKKLLLHTALLFSIFCFSQNEQLAQYYYDKGDFEKAKVSYEELLKSTPGNFQYFQKTIECYQQLKQLDLAEKTIQEQLKRYNQSHLLVELGYNYQLKKNDPAAKKQYEEALERVRKNANEIYSVGPIFEKKVLIDYALKSYQIATSINPNLHFNYQIALLYGQLGNTEMMISTFLDEAFANPNFDIQIQNQLARFMADEGDNHFSESLRKALITRVQKDQDVFWNEYLSWFYVQHREFGKAFIQEKAVYKRNPQSLNSILNLAQLTIDEDTETAKEILGFILENTNDVGLQIQAHTSLFDMKIEQAQEKDFPILEAELANLITKFGSSVASLSLQLIQAQFIAFNLKKPEVAKEVLKKALDLQLNSFQEAQVKMKLADILLFQEKFNQALLYYSQIEQNLKNDSTAHEASLMAAKTSYFQGDFAWASKQFKELKSAATQLIANDALDYFLLITDNEAVDSTQTALKKFAKGDYLLYQSRNQEAKVLFLSILDSFKGQSSEEMKEQAKQIEPITLLRLGRIYEKEADYALALSQYQAIIENYKDCIHIDEALFFAAEIENKKLQQPEKAKLLYEKVIFNHQDSIYFVDARKEYRLLRGDKNL